MNKLFVWLIMLALGVTIVKLALASSGSFSFAKLKITFK